jgi:hypothetical protein
MLSHEQGAFKCDLLDRAEFSQLQRQFNRLERTLSERTPFAPPASTGDYAELLDALLQCSASLERIARRALDRVTSQTLMVQR